MSEQTTTSDTESFISLELMPSRPAAFPALIFQELRPHLVSCYGESAAGVGCGLTPAEGDGGGGVWSGGRLKSVKGLQPVFPMSWRILSFLQCVSSSVSSVLSHISVLMIAWELVSMSECYVCMGKWGHFCF